MRLRRIILIIIAAVIVVPIAVILILVARFNPDRYKPQVIAAIEQATHRRVQINGPLHLAVSFSPSISASGITLANPPGFPDATMLTLDRLDARIALLPLLGHHVDIVNLVLRQPVITLERNAQGVGNWIFQQPAPQSAAAPNRAVLEPGKRPAIALQSVSIDSGTVILKQAASVRTLTIASMTAQAETLDSPLHIKMDAAYDGQPFAIAGTTGPISRLTRPGGGGAAGPWPIVATFSAAGATIHADGDIAHPHRLDGYRLKLDGTAADLAALDPYAGGYALPPLKQVAFSGVVAGSGSGMPEVTDARLQAGASDLGTIRPGLTLAGLTASMASLDSRVHLDAKGALAGIPLGVTGTAGPVRVLLPAPAPQAAPAAGNSASGPPAPPPPVFAADLAGSAGDARFTASGSMAAPLRLAGVDMKVTAQVPDLSRLSPLAGTGLPALTHLGATAMVIDPNGLGLGHAVGLQSLAFSSDQAQIGGAGSLALGSVPDLQAILNAPRIDLSAVLASMPPPAAPQPAAPPPAAPQPAGATPQKATPRAQARLIPDVPIPYQLLRNIAGNVELSVGQLLYKGVEYDAVQAHGLLKGGLLTVRPLSAQLPGGGVNATLTMNAAANPPQIAVTGEAPAFGLAPLLGALNLPHTAAGTVQAYADLSGQGATTRDVAATLNGTLGISLVNGVVDGAVITHFFGDVLRAENLPADAIGAQGPVQIRCFAARIDAHHGTGVLRALTLDSSRLYLTGTGTMAFGPETLNLVLQPQVQISNGAVPLPVRLGGTFAAPKPGIAPPGDYGATASAIGQQFSGNKGFLGQLARRLGIGEQAPSSQSCDGALALARFGRSGPAPAPAPAAMPSDHAQQRPDQEPSGPQNLLQNLFR